MNDAELKDKLTPEQYRILRQKGTEPPFSGKYLNESRDGMYTCAACGNELFHSSSKYESTTPGLIGWPSFTRAMNEKAIRTQKDTSMGMIRTEVVCAECGSHLGHVFPEDTALSETGEHYCINSLALEFDNKDRSDSSNEG